MNSSPNNPLHLAWCSHEAATYAVTTWHYSRRMPVGKLNMIGVWEDGHYMGAVIFGRGASPNMLPFFGLTQVDGCELVRVALRKTHKTPVSRIIRIAVKMLMKKNPGLHLIVSYADPAEGHHGGIYQAGNWMYTGESQPEYYPILNGRVTHKRTMTNRIAAGTIQYGTFPYVLKPGKHRYVLPLTDEVRARILPLSQPYPKRRAGSIGNDARPDQGWEGGVTPTPALQPFPPPGGAGNR